MVGGVPGGRVPQGPDLEAADRGTPLGVDQAEVPDGIEVGTLSAAGRGVLRLGVLNPEGDLQPVPGETCAGQDRPRV